MKDKALWTKEYRAYRRLYLFFRIVLFPFFRIRQSGREKIPQGPVMICANHSSNFDPILMSLAMGIEHHPHYLAKIELFKIPVVSRVIRAIGAISVNRGAKDIAAIKSAIRYLKAGEKVGIFPEGTRVKTDYGRKAKTGAIQIADQVSIPVLPVYISRKKPIFGVCRVIFGQPYTVNPGKEKLTAEAYEKLTEDLMKKITELQYQPAGE
jgi:1-acyl-sn-glycerol-3-phosphate acyltransferase